MQVNALGGAAHLSELFDSALDAVVGMDADGLVIAWNASAQSLFGWPADEALGRVMGDLIVPDQHREAHRKGLKRYLATGEGPVLNTRIKITALRKSGAEFPVELSILPIEDGAERTFYAFIRSREPEESNERMLERRVLEADVVAALSNALLEDLSTEAFTRLCLQKLCEVSGLNIGHLYRFDDPDHPTELVSAGVWHRQEEAGIDLVSVTENMRFRRGEGLPGRVWARGDAVFIPDLSADEGFFRKDDVLASGLTTGLGIPFRRGAKMIGVMEFFGASASALDRPMLEFAKIVGSHVGLAYLRKEEADRRKLLQRELAHRAGNSLAVLSSVFRACCRNAMSVEEMRRQFEPRLNAIAESHRMVDGIGAERPMLGGLVENAVAFFPDGSAITLSGADLPLRRRAVLPLNLVLQELVTNSLKHGRWVDDGRLEINWRQTEAGLELDWRETPGALKPDHRSGYGTELTRALIEATLGGAFERAEEDGAFVARLRVPGSVAGETEAGVAGRAV